MSSRTAPVTDTIRKVRDDLSALLTRSYSTPPEKFTEISQELIRLSTELAYASQDAQSVASETVTKEDKRPKKPVESPWPPHIFKSDMR